MHLRSCGPKPSALAATLHPDKNWWRLAVSRRALVGFNHVPSLDRPNLQLRLWSTQSRVLLQRDFYSSFAVSSEVLHFVRKNLARAEGIAPP